MFGGSQGSRGEKQGGRFFVLQAKCIGLRGAGEGNEKIFSSFDNDDDDGYVDIGWMMSRRMVYPQYGLEADI